MLKTILQENVHRLIFSAFAIRLPFWVTSDNAFESESIHPCVGECYDNLIQYRNGETRGKQSALMWSQSEVLRDEDMKNTAMFVDALSMS